MASTFINNLRLEEMTTGEQSGTWGTKTNTNLELIGEALGFGTQAITTNADTFASTIGDATSDKERAIYIKYTGALDSNCTITIGPNVISRLHFIENATTDSGSSGPYSIIISQGSGANVTIPNGDTKAVYLDGAGSGAAVVDAFASLSVVDLKVQDDLTVTDDASVGGDLLVSGEVQTANIGFTDGDNAMTIANGGAVTFPQASVFTSGFSASAGVTITTADNTDQLVLKSTDADASVGPVLRLNRDSGSPADSDLLGSIIFQADDDGGNTINFVEIITQMEDASAASRSADLFLKTRTKGSLISRIGMIDSTTVINDGGADIDFRVESDNQANMFVVDAGEDIVSIVGGGSHTVGGFKNALQIEGTTGQTSSMSIARNTAGTSPPYLQFGKSRGSSVGSNTIVQSGDDLGIITWNGADGTNRDTNGAMIRVAVDGTPGENDMPSRMMFSTTADGASSTSERMRIHNGGVVSIGNGIALGVGTANTASNVLDDYEEGTWTPTVTGSSSGSYALDSGHKSTYIKVGNICHVSTSIGLGTLTGTASGFAVIGGFPFNYNGGVSQSTAACFLIQANLASTHKQTHLMQSSSGTANTFFLPFMRDNDTNGETDLSIFSSSSAIIFSISYQTV